MGTPHELRNSGGGSLRSFWRLKFLPQFRLMCFKIKTNTLIELSSGYLGPTWSTNDILVAL